MFIFSLFFRLRKLSISILGYEILFGVVGEVLVKLIFYHLMVEVQHPHTKISSQLEEILSPDTRSSARLFIFHLEYVEKMITSLSELTPDFKSVENID